jgi:hypothetical protein
MTGFRDGRLGVYCCNHVFSQERPIRLVSHENDGDWQFLCGHWDHDDSQWARHVHLAALIARDPSLRSVADLPLGWDAERAGIDGAWVRMKQPSGWNSETDSDD